MRIDIKTVLALHLKWICGEEGGARARLCGANLIGANLRGAKDGAVCRMDFGGWSICVRAKKTSIGCQTHDNQKWLDWSPDDVAEMHENAKEWWIVHVDAVKAAILCVMKKANMERRPE